MLLLALSGGTRFLTTMIPWLVDEAGKTLSSGTIRPLPRVTMLVTAVAGYYGHLLTFHVFRSSLTRIGKAETTGSTTTARRLILAWSLITPMILRYRRVLISLTKLGATSMPP